MAKILGLPKLSPTMDEGTLVAWAKEEGDAVAVDDLLAEVETDKATMEFRSFDAGVLLKKLVEEGTTLAPDQPVAILGEQGEDISALLEEVAAGGASSGPPAADAKGSEPASPEPSDAKGSARAAPPSGAREASDSSSEPEGRVERTGDDRIFASPLVRRLARERDIDLRGLRGSGPHGRIIKRDLDAAPHAASAPSGGAGDARRPPRVEPLSSMRKTIARRLTESKRDIPHYYLTQDVDAGPMVDARRAINAELDASGEKISYNDLIVKACALALRRVPQVNASFFPDGIHFHQVVDVSIAVAIPEGLITPVLRDADRKGVAELAREAKALAQKARDKKLQPEEFQNGTFSVSNLGMFGIEDFSAVINPPEAAILAVGGLRDEPVVRDGVVVPGQRMRMTLSCDHRVVDGAVGAEFLAVVRRYLERPVTMLI